MENVKELAIDKVLGCSFLLSLFHRVEMANRKEPNAKVAYV